MATSYKTFKSLISAAVACILLSILGGCTRNNGDIGILFGTWQLNQIDTDNVPDTDYERNIFWKFQNDLIQLTRVYPEDITPGYSYVIGTWNEDNGYLFLNFTHHDGDPEGENDRYRPFSEMHLPYGIVSALQIEKMTSSEMVLHFTSPDDGQHYTYHLSKR